MKFTIERRTFANRLAVMFDALEKKTTFPILQNVLLRASEDGTILMLGYDYETGLALSIQAQVKVPGSVCVHLGRFTALLRNLPDGDLVLEADGFGTGGFHNDLRIKTDQEGTFRFPCIDPGTFPTVDVGFPATVGGRFALTADFLRAALPKVAFSTSTEEAAFEYNAMNLVLQPGKSPEMRVETSDSYRVSQVILPGFDAGVAEKTCLLIRKRAFVKLAGVASQEGDGSLEVAFDKAKAYFRTEGVFMSTPRLAAAFPDVAPLFQDLPPNSVVFPTAPLQATLARALIFQVSGIDPTMEIQVGGGHLKVTFNSETGGGAEQIPVPTLHMGDEVQQMQINGKHLVDYLTAMARTPASPSLRLHFSSEKGAPLLFTPEEQLGFNHRFLVVQYEGVPH